MKTQIALQLLFALSQMAMGQDLTINPADCAKVKAGSTLGNNSFLKGADLPWMVQVKVAHPYFKSHCEGSIINKYVVITRAYCTEMTGENPNEIWVNTYGNDDNGQNVTLRVKKILRHPEYKYPSSEKDVALVMVEKAIKFNKNIMPICLQSTPADLSKMTLVTVGIRRRSFGPAKPEGSWYSTGLKLLSDVDCGVKFKYGRYLKDTMFCGHGEGDEICKGDPGAPVVSQDGQGRYLQVGIATISIGCVPEIKGDPGLYTKLSGFAAWIDASLKSFDKVPDYTGKQSG